MSRQSLLFLREMLCNQVVPVADPNFLLLAQAAAQALAEIDALLAGSEVESWQPPPPT